MEKTQQILPEKNNIKDGEQPNYGSGILPDDLVEKMIKDVKIRTASVTKSMYLFFHFYFPHYITYPTAGFQKQIFHSIEKSETEDLFIIAFRGSGKSTIVTTAYPIWAILGRQQKKFVVLICQTRNQARQQLGNIKSELETNELLKNDLGPFSEDADEWGIWSLVFKKSGARIIAASTEQSIRGIRHRQWRPDLIILDDVQDVNSVKTLESRQNLSQWFHQDVIPLGEPGKTRIVAVGNLLHQDSLMMRIKQEIEKGRSGVFKIIPLLDNKDRIAWLGKYPNMAAVEEEKLRHGNIAFEREFNLRIISDDDQVIPFEWIKTYDDIPKNVTMSKIIMAVDLAISEKDTADKTAIVSAGICGWGKEAKIYFLPHPINKRMDFATMIEKVKNVFQANLNICQNVKILVEDVGYQRAAIQALSGEGLPVEGFKVNDDKRARLITVSGLIKNGQAIFPKIGTEIQIQQITGFGVERFDDLVDATTMILFDFLKEPPYLPTVVWLDNPWHNKERDIDNFFDDFRQGRFLR